VRTPRAAREQVGEQVATDPLLGLHERVLFEAEQRGDLGGAFGRAELDGAELDGARLEDERSEERLAGDDGDDHVVARAGEGHAAAAAPALVHGAPDLVAPVPDLDGDDAGVEVGVEDRHPAPQGLPERGGDRGGVPAPQDERGQVGVDAAGPFHGLDVPGQLPVRAAGLLGGLLRAGEQAGGLQDDRGVVGERRQQRDLLRRERVLDAVRGEQHADHLVAGEEGDAEQGDQALRGHGRVDLGVVRGLRHAGVAGRPAGLPPFHHQARQPHAGRDAQPEERRGHGAQRRAHPQFPGAHVELRQVGHVGADEVVGALDEPLQQLVDVTELRQLPCAGEECGQFLPAAPQPFRADVQLADAVADPRRRVRREVQAGQELPELGVVGIPFGRCRLEQGDHGVDRDGRAHELTSRSGWTTRPSSPGLRWADLTYGRAAEPGCSPTPARRRPRGCGMDRRYIIAAPIGGRWPMCAAPLPP
jgi:hypothetical protein